jgi:hypothetical protein
MKKSVSKPPRARALQAAPPALKKAKAAPELRASLSRLDTVTLGNRVFSAKPRELGGRKLDILPDMPDIRDRIYQPHLRALHPAIYPRIAFPILDQGPQSSCTGFSLAHLIDFLRFREVGGNYPERVSARMLYEMAKRNDEWDGTAYEGSSIRGAIKGFFRSGVCSDKLAPAHATGEWALTYDMAKEARETRLGAFFRVEPDISDYHAALNEVGAIYASAQIHTHWNAPDSKGSIQSGGKPVGGHAFAIVGYDDSGFWILNSWGQTWGRGGIAHWGYADWAATVMDAWVLQLGARAPAAFSAIPRATPSGTTGLFGSGDPHRGDIVGHFINIDDGRYVENGKYGSPSAIEMQQTVERLTMPTSNEGKGYDHLVIYAHGGLNKLEDDAKRIATWKRNKIFSRNNLYNFHLMWGSGLIDEVFGEISKSSAGRAAGRISDWLFEVAGKEIGAYAWRNMKQDANVAFYKQDANVNPEYDGGFVGLKPLLSGLDAAAKRPKLHLVGHSAGAIVLGHLLSALRRFKLTNLELGSIHLMAPACTVAFFREHYHPYLAGTGGRKLLDKIYLYNLTDELELDDTVSSSIPLLPAYARSLLYLVSRAYEEKPETPLAGMERYGMPQGAKLDIAYSKCKGGKVTASPSHGGFDNDPATISTIMTRIAGKPLKEPPTEDELTGY